MQNGGGKFLGRVRCGIGVCGYRCKNRAEGAPGPSHLGTGETPDLNRQEQPHGPAASVPKAPLPTTSEQIFPPPFCI